MRIARLKGWGEPKLMMMVELSRAPATPRRLSLPLARTLFPLKYTEELDRSDPSRSTSTLTQIPGIGRGAPSTPFWRRLGRLHIFPGDDVGARKNLAGWTRARRAARLRRRPTRGCRLAPLGRARQLPCSPRRACGPRRPRIGPARATRRGRRRDKAGRPAPRLRPRACAPAACRARGDARPAPRGRAEARRSGADGSATKGSQST
jgi:hypothetical protein